MSPDEPDQIGDSEPDMSPGPNEPAYGTPSDNLSRPTPKKGMLTATAEALRLLQEQKQKENQ